MFQLEGYLHSSSKCFTNTQWCIALGRGSRDRKDLGCQMSLLEK